MTKEERKKVTVPDLIARKGRGPKIVTVTAYDATMGRLVDEAGVDIVLVGDSLGMVVQGLSTTLPVTLEEVCYHGRAVARSLRWAHLVGDMPFMSYQVSVEQAVGNACRLLKEGGFESIKLEGGTPYAKHVRAIVDAGIPVMGHIGLTPQFFHTMGGFKVQGKTEESAARIIADAQALEAAGAFSIVIEGVPADLARRITQTVSVPTIGIGAGVDCDGQVLVCYDYLGMTRTMQPKFVKHFAEVGDQIVEATQTFISEVRTGAFPSASHSFGMGGKKTSEPERGQNTNAANNAYGPVSDK